MKKGMVPENTLHIYTLSNLAMTYFNATFSRSERRTLDSISILKEDALGKLKEAWNA